MTRLSCMGGYKCPLREQCKHHQTDMRDHPVDRLCEDGVFDAYEPAYTVNQEVARARRWAIATSQEPA